MSTQTEIELFPSHRDYYEMLKKLLEKTKQSLNAGHFLQKRSKIKTDKTEVPLIRQPSGLTKK